VYAIIKSLDVHGQVEVIGAKYFDGFAQNVEQPIPLNIELTTSLRLCGDSMFVALGLELGARCALPPSQPVNSLSKFLRFKGPIEVNQALDRFLASAYKARVL
jgi:hypothetical protein